MARRLTVLAFTLAAVPAVSEDGQSLAETWCGACHLFPEPELLDRATWLDNVLPEMGARLGFMEFRGRAYVADRAAPPGVYAEAPLLDSAEWERIIAFYEQNAPERLTRPAMAVPEALDLFDVEVPESTLFGIPTTTAVFVDELAGRVLVGNGSDGTLTFYSNDLTTADKVHFNGPVSHISRTPGGNYLVTSMGAIGREVAPVGALSLVAPSGDRSGDHSHAPLVKGLLRPVDALVADIDSDGLDDYIVADFGRYTGSLTLHFAHPGGGHREVALLMEDGPIAAAWEGGDLIALIAQENERIVRFRNLEQGGTPVEEVLLEFPPSQGSSSLSVMDFDGDGFADLLYTAGDNADISPVFKPYHGIYLFRGAPDGAFHQALFWPLDGAYGAVAEDFDGDGDMDIAAVAFFADFIRDQGASGFVYLENIDDGFRERRLSGLGHLGRWAVISAGDVDGDGDPDIVLGNLAYGAVGPADVPNALRNRWMNGPDFVLLRNRTN